MSHLTPPLHLQCPDDLRERRMLKLLATQLDSTARTVEKPPQNWGSSENPQMGAASNLDVAPQASLSYTWLEGFSSIPHWTVLHAPLARALVASSSPGPRAAVGWLLGAMHRSSGDGGGDQSYETVESRKPGMFLHVAKRSVS